MQGAYLLATLSIAMFVGSYLAGSIPLMFSLSQNRVRLFSIFGAGLLVGTALSVIIPEGVESLYAAQMESYKLSQQQHRVEAGAALILEKSIDNAAAVAPPRVIPKDAQLNKNLNVVVDTQESRAKRNDFNTLHPKRQLQQALPVLGSLIEPDIKEESHRKEFGMLHEAAAAANDKNDHESAMHEHIQETSVHKAIGFSLIIGFILMLIIDQGTRSVTSKAGERQRFKMTATIGLVVHAAADGVALGSASATDRTDVQFIVFLAIMLHKAPAAFGLVSFLLVEGLERVRVRRHLLVFSSAAPITALLTFYAIIAVGSESLSSGLSTGVLMLFSAGTFLYVATVHVLPELVNSSDDYQLVGPSGNIAGHSHTGGGPSFTIKELATIIIGALLPAVLASHHSH